MNEASNRSVVVNPATATILVVMMFTVGEKLVFEGTIRHHVVLSFAGFIFLSSQVRSAVEMPQPNFLVTIHEMRDFKNQAGLMVSNLC